MIWIRQVGARKKEAARFLIVEIFVAVALD
jgi:hypothetical protein